MTTDQLLALINAFLKRTGMGRTYFGAAAVNDSKLVARLEGGGSVTLETYNKIVRFMADREGRVAK